MAQPHTAFGNFLANFGRAIDARSDDRLLADFYADRDEAAFAILVRRHQRMVWSVCSRILIEPADAEDAFQATFLILAKTGRLLGNRGNIGGLLYRVADRVARRARTMVMNRKQYERKAGRTEAVTSESAMDTDLFEIISDELGQLPENHRLAVVVCDLEGLSRADAASRLGWNEGTLSTRLYRGRKQLARRLRARGVVAPAVGLVGLFTTSVVPARAADVTAELARVFVETGLMDRAVPMVVATLVSQTTKEMAMRMTAKVLATLALATGVLGFGWVGLTGENELRTIAAPVPEVKKESKPELPLPAVPMLRNRKVLKELKCTPEQRVAIEDLFDSINDAQRDDRIQFHARMKALPVGTPKAVHEHLIQQYKTKLEQQQLADIKAIKSLGEKLLKPSQVIRFAQIDLQTRWAETFAEAKIQGMLRFTDEQKKQLSDLMGVLGKSFIQENVVVQGGGGFVFSPDAVGGSGGFEKIEAMLTKDQKEIWKKWTGDAIDFEKLDVSGSHAVHRVTQKTPQPIEIPGQKNDH